MTFRDWQQLEPTAAARELHRRVRSLPRAQQRAAIASLRPQAQLADELSRADRSAPLGAVPYFLKDLFDVVGQMTFAGSNFLPEIRPLPASDSAIVSALQRQGAVLAGKTQLHEFAYGITGENPHHGDCDHPRHAGRTAGGSSSGSAAVVAAGIAPLAIGTDTGGSIRVPAAFCGLHGFRAGTRDSLIADAVPLAPSFDAAGWMTSNAADLATVTRALVGGAETAPASSPRGCYLELPGVDAEVAKACSEAANHYAPPADHNTAATLHAGFAPARETYNTIVAAETWAFHASWFDRFRNRYDANVAQRLERGRSLTPADVDQARAAAANLRSLWKTYFDAFDFLVLPATPFPALRKAECTLENRHRLLDLTTPASIGALPVLTVPVSLPSGLSCGLQIIARDVQSPVFTWALTRA